MSTLNASLAASPSSTEPAAPPAPFADGSTPTDDNSLVRASTEASVLRSPARSRPPARRRARVEATAAADPAWARWALPVRHVSIARALLILEAHYEGVCADDGARVISIQEALADVLAEVEIRYFVDLQPGTPAALPQLRAGEPVEWIDLIYPVSEGPGQLRRTVRSLPLVAAWSSSEA